MTLTGMETSRSASHETSREAPLSHKEIQASLPRSLKFNPLITPRTTIAQGYVKYVIDALAQQEERQRKRRAKDQAIYEQQVSALASALALQVLREDSRPLSFQRSKRVLGKAQRYKPSFITDKLRDVADAMEETGLIDQTIGSRNPFQAVGQATLIEPTPDLLDIIGSSGVDKEDFGKALPPETIILKEVKSDRFDRGKLLDYEDTNYTHHLREELRDINDWIAKADLRFDMSHAKGELIDTKDICLRRIFTGGSLGFDQCGRLFGGFWQELTKDQRKAGLTINGEKIVTLDYGQMILRIAYSEAKVQRPSGDLYAIGDYPERYRQGFKKLTSAMLFSRTALKKKPKGTKELLPERSTVRELTKAITRHHQGIAGLFYKGIGHGLMFKESEVLVTVLKELRDRGIVALPVHDALIVAEGHIFVVTQVMKSVFCTMLSVEAVVRLE